ncbi:hypothetical protein [Paenibacillus sp. P22]|uniref:hypothetical protein n=1 Tax=Paenibacillus sp. P22 TaxID=483908 RepID=UPI00038F32AE|nr:hypothetical protein [Paenibacillus sp. P22]CDN41180.1 Uncharacterized protein BN871_AC_00740 [Paenibacillus sp. P22]
MRKINEVVTSQQLSIVQKTVISEDVQSIYEHQTERFVNVTTALRDTEGAIVSTRVHAITGVFYDLLMSQSPDFAPGKPANEYREADIWHVIDLITAEAGA